MPKYAVNGRASALYITCRHIGNCGIVGSMTTMDRVAGYLKENFGIDAGVEFGFGGETGIRVTLSVGDLKETLPWPVTSSLEDPLDAAHSLLDGFAARAIAGISS